MKTNILDGFLFSCSYQRSWRKKHMQHWKMRRKNVIYQILDVNATLGTLSQQDYRCGREPKRLPLKICCINVFSIISCNLLWSQILWKTIKGTWSETRRTSFPFMGVTWIISLFLSELPSALNITKTVHCDVIFNLISIILMYNWNFICCNIMSFSSIV